MVDVTPEMVRVTVRNGRTMVGGRVIRATVPDSRDPRPLNAELGAADFLFGSQGFDKEATSTRAADKALLVALGVDGDVPLAQARINAGLPVDGSAPAKLVAGHGWVAANDNTKLAAKAA